MPEFVDRTTKSLSKEILKSADGAREKGSLFPYHDSKIENLVKEENLEIIGHGAECVVVSSRDYLQKKKYFGLANPPFRKDIVVAIDYNRISDAKEAKRVFYIQRILSTLFPHNFPRFYTSYGQDSNNEGSGTIRQKINPQSDKKYDLKYPISIALRDIRNLEMPIKIDDGISGNFIIGDDGGEYYVDKTRLKYLYKINDKSFYLKWKPEKILEYLTQKGYSDLEQKIVMRSLARLQALTDDEDIENLPY